MTGDAFDVGPFDIAVIGMSGRFPGATSVEALWQALQDGKELTAPRLATLNDGPMPGDVGATKIELNNMIDAPFDFDAEFFGVAPFEALNMDPQHRLALECCYDVLVRANIPHRRHQRQRASGHQSIGLFASKYTNTYMLDRIYPNAAARGTISALQTQIGNDNDHLAPFIAYKLGLSGPAMAVQSACSSSLVATHLACQHLMTAQCDAALVTAATVSFWQNGSYIVEDGALTSRDGHCRPFSQQADGTVYANGVCAVVLKRLEDAIKDGNDILGVIRGSATNNDAAQKLGYAAPSIQGQVEVIRRAHAAAGICASDLSFIECHGTGTVLGDEIELKALEAVFAGCVPKAARCALGSSKANFGHLGVASGLAGLIKACLCLSRQQLTPQINCKQQVEAVSRAKGAFRIAERAEHLQTCRRIFAGVSSFGLGGTNAHVVVANWPRHSPSLAGACQTLPHALLFPFSARSRRGLVDLLDQTALAIRDLQTEHLEAIARTLHHEREALPFRVTFSAHDQHSLYHALIDKDLRGMAEVAPSQRIIFLFPQHDPQLATADAMLRRMSPNYAAKKENVENELRLGMRDHGPLNSAMETFAIQCALVRTLGALGIHPNAVCGHGCGLLAAMAVTARLEMTTAWQLLKIDNAAELRRGLVDRLATLSVNNSVQPDLFLSGPMELTFGPEDYHHELLSAALDPTSVFIEIGVNGEFSALQKEFSPGGAALCFAAAAATPETGFLLTQGLLWCRGGASLPCQVAIRGHRMSLPAPPLEPRHFELPLADMPTSRPAPGERSRVEDRLRRLWRGIFSASSPSEEDLIFEFGATSLSVAAFTEAVQAEFGVTVEIADIYETPTLGAQIALLKKRLEEDNARG